MSVRLEIQQARCLLSNLSALPTVRTKATLLTPVQEIKIHKERRISEKATYFISSTFKNLGEHDIVCTNQSISIV
jgi:hypothetical protein